MIRNKSSIQIPFKMNRNRKTDKGYLHLFYTCCWGIYYLLIQWRVHSLLDEPDKAASLADPGQELGQHQTNIQQVKPEKRYEKV